jgi:hypothetical protein
MFIPMIVISISIGTGTETTTIAITTTVAVITKAESGFSYSDLKIASHHTKAAYGSPFFCRLMVSN